MTTKISAQTDATGAAGGVVKQHAGQLAQHAKETVSHAAQAAKAKLGDTASALNTRRESVEDATYQYVLRQPGLTLAVVAILAGTAGYLLGSRSDTTQPRA
jgi:ElaB/YqjD/DUF883 family membrane-anchored ribosome-binding protein